jgi:hypothetical protein
MCKACNIYREKRKAYRVLVGKPEGKRILGRPRRKWEDNIKVGLREPVWTRFICFRMGSVEGCCEDGNELSGSIEFSLLKSF